MKAFISSGVRDIARGILQTGGAQRRFTRAIAYIGGANRTVATFLTPLTVSAPDAYGSRFGATAPGVVASSPTTATPSGGLGPYTYAWSLLTGSMTITNPTSATTRFSRSLPVYGSASATARVTCTDSLGAVATADFSILLESEGNL